MKAEKTFYKTVLKIALPVTLQSLLQSSFSVIDQVMTGQLGSTSIAGIGLGGKFSSIFSVLVSAIAAVAGIMIAQYMGKRDSREVSRSFFINMIMAVSLAVLFSVMCGIFPSQIMGLYTEDAMTRETAAEYIRILAVSYIPMAVGTLLSTLLRCMEAAVLPLYASIIAAAVNTGLNYVLIFGKFGFPKMGVNGAAIATVISQAIGCILIIILFFIYYKKQNIKLDFIFRLSKSGRLQYIGILLPIIICEFFWSLGENVYTAIYGHIGTDPCAAMTLTVPIQVLMIGALNGVAQAAGILIGKALGNEEYERAYEESKKLMIYGLAGSVILSIALIFLSRYYVQIYNVEKYVQDVAGQILFAFAIISPVKVLNMILGGGIVRSGGKTKYMMCIDFIGTWIFGVPLGLLSAFVFKLSIPYVYFILSLEECVRFVITFAVFRKKNWMRSLKVQ
ncbi:MAG: MATE family efflux transporter [Lachnospiraceae bacterium]|nr:MATE family efflux transporter [Lachnospiraceae bacterium]